MSPELETSPSGRFDLGWYSGSETHTLLESFVANGLGHLVVGELVDDLDKETRNNHFYGAEAMRTLAHHYGREATIQDLIDILKFRQSVEEGP